MDPDRPAEPARCEECGAPLTMPEIEHALETGGPELCTIHAAEVVPLEPEDDGGPAGPVAG